MSVVVIVVLRLLCCLLLPSTRIVDCKIEVHCRTSFLLSFFPAAVAFCSCVGDSFATQEFVFFIFWVVFRVSSCERLTAYRCSFNGFVERNTVRRWQPPREPPFSKPEPCTESRNISLHKFSHAYSGLGICHQSFGPFPQRRSCCECLTSYKLLFFTPNLLFT